MRGKLFLIPGLLFFLVAVLAIDASGKAAISPLDDLELAKKFAPVLYFHEKEVFRPQPVEVLIEHARLRKDRPFWFDLNILNSVVISDLVTYKDPSLFLDIWYGSARQSDFKNYTAHRVFYTDYLSPENGGPPASVYASITHDQKTQKIIIQYWLFYFYNDWFNKHEGDWELIQIVLDQNQEPEWVILSQHHGGTRRSWTDTQIEDDTHPAVYVALGSHANYFWGDEIYPNGMEVGTKKVEVLDRTGSMYRTTPEVLYLPPIEALSAAYDEYASAAWLIFSGHWGEISLQGDFGGPGGPATKGSQWEEPYAWGMEQPLDMDTWYLNRFKVIVESSQTSIFDPVSITALDSRALDVGSNHLIYHADPPPSVNVDLTTNLMEDTVISASWPSLADSTVDRFDYSGFSLSGEQAIHIAFKEDSDPVLQIKDQTIQPIAEYVESATWDAPDLVWFAGYLPASQIVLGLLIAIAAGIFPGLLYAALIYQFDRYEKEPFRLVTTSLIWGALPSILVAILVQVFFSLPPDFIKPHLIETIQTGLVSPFTEEAIKGAILLFISVRHRKDFNDILDGIVYGAIVGIGFAISGNIIGYIGSFLVTGFQGLGIIIFVEGFLSGLNHALYSAIFGAGLAYYVNSKKGQKALLVPFGAFVLALLTNGLHELLTSNIVNRPVLGFLINWTGIAVILVIMIWARNRERKMILLHLSPQFPASVTDPLIHPLKRKSLYNRQTATPRRHYRKAINHQLNLLTKLAFARQKAIELPSEANENRVQEIQTQLTELDKQTNFLNQS